jgi:CheY-like chemotaxis protein
MRARFDREDRVEREVEQHSRLVFPPFRSHYLQPTGHYWGPVGDRRPEAQGSPRILFIEDDRFIADMYRLGLEESGWSVEIAHDGLEGLNRAMEDPPALILLDLLLPRMDGFEVLRQLRANERTRATPVLIVSNASGLGGREEETRSLGIVDWLVKANTTPAALISRVSRILGRD